MAASTKRDGVGRVRRMGSVQESEKARLYRQKLAHRSMAGRRRFLAAERDFWLLVGLGRAATYIWGAFVKRAAPKSVSTGP